MALLLYQSKEMFSSTELIRKSKMIFDKIVNDEIEKAIILRDGKPGFLLMDFKKYESIMADYEKLKNDYEKLTKEKTKKKKNKPSAKIETGEKGEDKEPKVDRKEKMEKLLNSLPNNIETKKELEEFKAQQESKTDIPKDEDIDMEKVEPEINEQDEINDALFKIKDLNFSPEEKAKVEAQVKERIKKARLEREKLLQEQESMEKEELKEELQLQIHIKEENKKKEQELKEFWD